LLNGATPFTADKVTLMPAGFEVSVTGAVDEVTRVPFESCTCTTTGEIGEPTTAPLGSAGKKSLEAALTAIVKD